MTSSRRGFLGGLFAAIAAPLVLAKPASEILFAPKQATLIEGIGVHLVNGGSLPLDQLEEFLSTSYVDFSIDGRCYLQASAQHILRPGWLHAPPSSSSPSHVPVGLGRGTGILVIEGQKPILTVHSPMWPMKFDAFGEGMPRHSVNGAEFVAYFKARPVEVR